MKELFLKVSKRKMKLYMNSDNFEVERYNAQLNLGHKKS